MTWLFNKYPYILILISITTLTGSFIAEYGFDIQPCLLCLYQRYLWAGLALVSLMFMTKTHKYYGRIKLFLGCYCLALGLFANYQVLVEEKVLPAPLACRSHIPKDLSADDLWEHLQKAPARPPCDREPKRFFGLSLAAYSGLLALFLGLIGFLGWLYDPRQKTKLRKLDHASSR